MNGTHRDFPRCAFSQRLTAWMVAIWLSVPGVFAAQQEKNPPGDIPDSQVFVSYPSPLGLSLKVPEGWARTERADGARFADKYNVVDVSVTAVAVAPSEASAKSVELPALVKAGNNVEPGKVDSVTLKGGPAIRIRYKADSEPNPMTHRQLRQEHERYLFYRDGRQAALDLSAPVGADNVDQWQLMANSLRWN
ncbi:hypothetical protein [Pseudomonas sp. 6D_7.1_Bac1]|uniref:hypothetical protein n=1 Tax=Pseudomonas sp. 6D_7.1_Bac1 TaxID=2971615 RepID=UPI0021C6E620|nr:hypothetical protein [Pseudomonas sp. 6D_7.1_Bac1]MCU1752717.1 hypothetical protein [Pseudomonas sp. 6D_7.1_Bac1]